MCTYVCACVGLYMHAVKCASIGVCVCVCVCLCVCVCVCVCVCMFVCYRDGLLDYIRFLVYRLGNALGIIARCNL